MSATAISPGRLREKVAIVTGSSSGMGRAIATAFSNEGAHLVCVDLRPEARPHMKEETLITTHELLQKQGGRVIFVQADVSEEQDFKAAVEAAVREFGRLDILVNNAGVVLSPRPVHETTVEVWDRTMNVNARSVFLGCKYAIGQMLKQETAPGADRGWIVNMASSAALIGRAAIPAYSASKGAITAMTRQIAVEYAKDRIHCNAICPGSVYTSLISAVGLLSDELKETENALHPFRGIGMPQDVAKAALFLASEDASWITGVILPVDGGITAH